MVEYLTQQQLQRLRELAKAPRDALLIEVQYQTGCSVSELINIKKADVASGRIRIQDRVCVVTPKLTEQLLSYAKTHKSPYVFATRQSPQLTQKRVQQIVKKYLRKLSCTLNKKTPHILRYTHIAHAIKQHIPFSAIKQQTGLGELRLSQLFSELSENDLQGYTEVFA